jgi:hypothetical protein
LSGVPALTRGRPPLSGRTRQNIMPQNLVREECTVVLTYLFAGVGEKWRKVIQAANIKAE